MATIISLFNHLPLEERATRLCIMLGVEGDPNIHKVFKNAFGRLGATKMDSIFEATLKDVSFGVTREDGSGLPRTPAGQFLKLLKKEEGFFK